MEADNGKAVGATVGVDAAQRILAVDPSWDSCGIAYIQEDADLIGLALPVGAATDHIDVHSRVLPLQDLLRLLWTHSLAVDRLIIEKPAGGGRGADAKTMQAFGALCGLAYQLGIPTETYGPGQWKPLIKAQGAGLFLKRKFKTDHERDAFGLYLYDRFMRTRRN